MSSSLMWFRRDLRAHDNAALAAALGAHERVYAVFVFDRAILDPLLDTESNPFASAHDRRVEFIARSLDELDAALRARGGGLIVRYADALDEIPRLARALGVATVHANRDYEPAAVARDEAVAQALRADGIALRLSKDQCVFERDEVLTGTRTPFSVYTPYKNAWLKRVTTDDLAERDTSNGTLAAPPRQPAPDGSADDRPVDAPRPSIEAMGFAPTNLLDVGVRAGMSGGAAAFDDFRARMNGYADLRDYPARRGPSYLSVHLRFGTVSVRALAREAYARMQRSDRGAEVWLSELIWRDFYFQILHHHPRVVGHAFKPDYDRIEWDAGPDADARFAAWCEGRTGYPIVDAAMLQIARTGWMHNRLRMIVASFMTKDLGIDWRRGEAYFAARLNDYDLSANNGGWQWAASTGCDAQPYFRIFNPVSQSEKFDPEGRFIRKYLPALAKLSDRAIHAPWAHREACEAAGVVLGRDYPAPIVDHDVERKRTLERFGVVKSKATDGD